jgi:hypothetical protein
LILLLKDTAYVTLWLPSPCSLALADLAAQAQAGMGKQRLRLVSAWLREKARM